MDHVRGSHGSAGTIDPQQHGFDVLVISGQRQFFFNPCDHTLVAVEKVAFLPLRNDARDVQHQNLVCARALHCFLLEGHFRGKQRDGDAACAG